MLVADPKGKKPEFTFGVEKKEEYKDKINTDENFAVRKKVSHYRKMSLDEELGYKEKDAVEYTLQTDHAAFEIGNMVKRDGKDLYLPVIMGCFLMQQDILLKNIQAGM